jgi:hypothetical protein
MSHGEHIRIVGGGRVVHAIDCGDRTVLHLVEGDGGPATVRRTLLSDLTQGDGLVEVVRAAHKVYPAQMVVARAFSKLGDPAVGSMFPTSEHFAAWCVSGQPPRPPTRTAPPRPAPVLAPAPVPGPGPGALEALRVAVKKAVGAASERKGKGKVAKAATRAGQKVERKPGARVAAAGRPAKGSKGRPGAAAGARKSRPAARKARPAARKAGAGARGRPATGRPGARRKR